jgi:alkylhydroperoxidase/carboxymuconolactone decarboxylase family protein YurZ
MDTLTEIQTNHSSDTIQSTSSKPKPEPRLQDLIPIAVVIAAGCETCAERMVGRALKEGSSWEDIDKTLRILTGMQKLDCFVKAIGPEVIGRMNKPIAAAQRTLHEALNSRNV